MTRSKTVLIIAYEFPPAANVGIYRPVKFAQYLPASGWAPVVLTVTNGKFPKYDERLLGIVPKGLRIYRAPSFELFNYGENKKRRITEKRGLLARVYVRLCEIWNFLAIPDNKVLWVPAATVTALRIIKRENISCVFATGKPFSSFIIGYLLKRMRGVRLVIDYRDPWTQNIAYNRRTRLHAWIDRRLEQAMIHASDKVVANTQHNEEMLVRDFGSRDARDKFTTIHNGFDSEDFVRAETRKPSKFTITYAGVFYASDPASSKDGPGADVMKTYSSFYFFEALKKLAPRRPDIIEDLRVNFMGMFAKRQEDIIRRLGLENVVRVLGFLDYEEHLAVLKGSNALLLVLSSGERSRGWIPSKFFSYLGSGKPILGLVPEGEVRDIMREARAGLFVDPDDVDGTAEALIELYDGFYKKGVPFIRDEAKIAKFDRKYLTALLVRALEG